MDFTSKTSETVPFPEPGGSILSVVREKPKRPDLAFSLLAPMNRNAAVAPFGMPEMPCRLVGVPGLRLRAIHFA